MIKKLTTSVAASAVILLLGALPVFAQADCDFVRTGPYSGNTCTRTLNKKAELKLYNYASVTRNQTGSSNTGGNVANYNTNYTGSFSTGAAEGVLGDNVDLNNTDMGFFGGIDQGGGDSDQTGSIVDSGPYSGNVITKTVTKKADVKIDNYAYVTNDQSGSANSGGNSQSYNTVVTGGGINTGGAKLEIKSDTKLNTTAIWIKH
ncbi:hypothetical protein HZB96_01720 [Candidatus Gottesmanbacteria bacterium]|nr:hypothetical protein [Candidatus Gottesmanbacteria bacterium]